MKLDLHWTRRDFLTATAVGSASIPTFLVAAEQEPVPQPVFRHRGYYTIGTRFPTAGLAIWKGILDGMQADGCNLLIHWIAGGFKSLKFPETWQYNKDHENIKSDFTREMIDYAHSKGIRVILGFTPFGYDGVNQYTATHPELTSIAKGGKPTGEFGISCWGHSLCPSQPKSSQFMLDYAREMLFDFYPNADGLFIESSDYSTCFCKTCGENNGEGHFKHEFQFVKTISDEVWDKNPQALIVVYPHYFSGGAVVTNDATAKGASFPFDDRWTLFFTPHSTALNPEQLAKAKDSLWWDSSMIFGTPEDVKQGALATRRNRFTGYIPSLEAMSFLPSHIEGGEPWTVTKRQVPFGIGWVPFDRPPYDELPIRAIRIAYREFTKNPDLPMQEFRERLGREIFGDRSTEQHVADLLAIQRCVTVDRDWALPSPLLEPLRVKWFSDSGKLTDKRRDRLAVAVKNLQSIAARYRGRDGIEAEMQRAAAWIAALWTDDNARLLGLEN